MNKVDYNKPLYLSDGTPVRFHGLANYGQRISVTVPGGHLLTGLRRFNRDGTRYYPLGKDIRLINGLDLTKPMQTREGDTARFIARDSDTLIFEVSNAWSGKVLVRRNVDGRVPGSPSSIRGIMAENGGDIVNVEPKPVVTELFFNVYSDGSPSSGHTSMGTAENCSKVGKERVGILTVVKHDGKTVSTSYRALKPFTRPNSYTTSEAVDA